MKIFVIFLLTFTLVTSKIWAMEPRSEMMVRYYEGKPIIEKRPKIDLEDMLIKLNKTDWVKLDSEGLHASKELLILDTFSLTYNPNQHYIMLKSQELTFPSEKILLVRKANELYVIDLEKEILIGKLSLEWGFDSYISLGEDGDGKTTLALKRSEKMKQSKVYKYYNGAYIAE